MEAGTIEDNLAAALGSAGVQDMISGVKEGELTLLNTKASKYAVFVRRIATQVFNELKTQAWKRISYSEIKSIQKFNEFIVKLDKNGKLLSISPSDTSGSINFDNILNDSLKLRANDPHPVESAISPDGTYTFIFQSNISSNIYGGGRNEAPTERRYLIM